MGNIIGVGNHVYMPKKGGPTPWEQAAIDLGAIWAYDFNADDPGKNAIATGPDIDTFVDTADAVDANAGEGLAFNGTSAYCTAPDDVTNRDIFFGTTNWVSMEATIRTPAAFGANVHMIATKGPTVNAGFQSYYSSTQTTFLFQWSNYTGYVIGPTLATDTLYHIVWCMQLAARTNHQVYYDSVLQTPTYPGNGPGGVQGSDTSKDLMFGARSEQSNPLDHFNGGDIYSCAMYDNTQLSQAQVDAQYALAVT